jgi:hypothetical protein
MTTAAPRQGKPRRSRSEYHRLNGTSTMHYFALFIAAFYVVASLCIGLTWPIWIWLI